MNQPKKLFLIVLQVVLWSAFLSLPYFMMPHQMENARLDNFARHYFPNPDMAENIFLSSLALNLCLIGFFYFHQYFLFDRFVIRRKFGQYAFILFAAFVIIFFISFNFRRALFPPNHNYRPFIGMHDVVRVGTWYLLILLVSLGLKLLGQWRLAEQRTREIENEQLRTELSFLHAQINPHFLFNSLNTIYSLALKKSDAAPRAIIKLSQLLRYVVDEANRPYVPLSQEIEYLNNYLELQKLRNASNVVVRFDISGPVESAAITPLLLLPFVENAFKYGISSSQESIVEISLRVEAKNIHFNIKNLKFLSDDFETEKYSTGIGIPNVQRRLDLLYPGQYSLKIDDTNNFYQVHLNIPFI
jgi:two-component system, LytTR family, sensor kinase